MIAENDTKHLPLRTAARREGSSPPMCWVRKNLDKSDAGWFCAKASSRAPAPAPASEQTAERARRRLEAGITTTRLRLADVGTSVFATGELAKVWPLRLAPPSLHRRECVKPCGRSWNCRSLGRRGDALAESVGSSSDRTVEMPRRHVEAREARSFGSYVAKPSANAAKAPKKRRRRERRAAPQGRRKMPNSTTQKERGRDSTTTEKKEGKRPDATRGGRHQARVSMPRLSLVWSVRAVEACVWFPWAVSVHGDSGIRHGGR